MKDIKKYCIILNQILAILLLVTLVTPAASFNDPLVSVGNITRIRGVRDNQLFGFGLVMGLAGTGDSNRYGPTIQSHANMLNNMGIEVTTDQVNSRNVAAVMVTATLPAFAHIGDDIDITVSSMGDARSLQGGTLFMTPLQAGNGDIYAIAQGPISIGGFNLQSGGNQVRQNHPTTAMIPNGAIVERELNFEISNEELTYVLDNPNFETARNIALAVNYYFDLIHTNNKLAEAVDAGQVRIKVPDKYRNDVVDYIAKIDNLNIRPGLEARVIINERTGTIVMGHNVRMSTVSVAHGNLTVTIKSEQEISQPPSFSGGETVVTEETNISIDEEEGSLTMLPTSSTVQEMVTALNSMGATPRDIIAILQMIHAQGALHADLELR